MYVYALGVVYVVGMFMSVLYLGYSDSKHGEARYESWTTFSTAVLWPVLLLVVAPIVLLVKGVEKLLKCVYDMGCGVYQGRSRSNG